VVGVTGNESLSNQKSMYIKVDVGRCLLYVILFLRLVCEGLGRDKN